MNKKIFILLAVLAALALVFVACENDPVTEDTTVTTEAPTDAATDAPTEEATTPAETPTEETTTPAETPTEEVTTEEVTTEEVTTEEPTTEAPRYDNYDVPMDSWGVTGHAPGLTAGGTEGNGPMVTAGGLEKGALLHQGAVSVGEIDLSKYEKVVISYGIDNSDVTIGRYDANANNRVILSSVDTHLTMSPAEENVIASATYTLQGWALVTVEIDLTEVDYNGPVFVTYDTLEGTFMLIGKIEFIGAVIPEGAETPDEGGNETPDQGGDETPDAPETYTVDLNTAAISGSWPNLMDGAGLGMPGTNVAALHYGSLNLGEVDLSKYSKVTITYTTPAGELNGSNFDNEYEATGKRVMLLNAPSAVQEGTAFEMLPADEAIITSAHYEKAPVTGEVMTVELDLTAIDDNGQVYLTFDARNANNEFGAIGYLVYVMAVTFTV